ncbi:MFS transporter, partial [Actinosynnema sp. NPDC059797]
MTETDKPHRAALIRNRPFAALWLARSTSYFGDFITLTALTLLLYERSASPLYLGAALAARALPQALGPIAGAVADRFDPRRVMIVCDLLRMVTIAVIAVALPPAPVLIPLIAVTAVLSTFFLPASKSMVPRLVPRASLGPANAALGVSHNVAFAAGPVLGAVLFQAFGPTAVFALDAATYLISALLLVALPARAARRTGERGTGRVFAGLSGLGGEAREGVRYIWRHRVVRIVAIGLFLSVAFSAMDNVALVFRLRDDLGQPASALGLTLSVFGVAMIAAPLLLLSALRSFSGLRLLTIGLLCSGIGTAATGLVDALPAVLVAYAIAGAGNGFENIAVDTTIGEHVEEEWLGRVFGTVYGPIFLADALASLGAATLLELVSPGTVFVIAGAGVIAIGLVVWFAGVRYT